MAGTAHEGDSDYPVDVASTLAATDIAAAWRRELPGVPTASIEVITPLWRAAKALADDRRRTLQRLNVEPATLDLLSTLRRAGPPYELTTRQITERALVTAGAISQRIARAEQAGLVIRSRSDASRRAIAVALTPAGHELIERTVRELLTHEESLIASLTDEERPALATMLTKLAAIGDSRRPID
jgi:DNA-binding MarR family transcriptional regulator